MNVARIFLCTAVSMVSTMHASEILIQNAHGDLVYLEAESYETVEELQVRADLEPLSLSQEGESVVPMAFERNFNASLTVQEMNDIRYIVTFLSDNNEVKILFNRSSLDSAGDRILHVHPLMFLQYVFSDPKLKVKVRNIKGKSIVWRQFIGGLKNSLAEEHLKDNLLPEYYEEMASEIGIKVSDLDHAIMRADWDELINTLIKFVTHDTGADRYNM